MEELMSYFKQALEEMMDEWYESLEQLMDDVLFSLSFSGCEIEEQYDVLEALMIEVLQERFGDLLEEQKETPSH